MALPDFKLHYKAMIIKRYDNGMKTNVQINGIQQSPETNPPFDDQLTYDKIVKDIQWDKDILFNKWCQENQTGTCKMTCDHFLTPNIYQKTLKMDYRLACNS